MDFPLYFQKVIRPLQGFIFDKKKYSVKAKHPRICPSFGGSMPEAQIKQCPLRSSHIYVEFWLPTPNIKFGWVLNWSQPKQKDLLLNYVLGSSQMARHLHLADEDPPHRHHEKRSREESMQCTAVYSLIFCTVVYYTVYHTVLQCTMCSIVWQCCVYFSIVQCNVYYTVLCTVQRYSKLNL